VGSPMSETICGYDRAALTWVLSTQVCGYKTPSPNNMTNEALRPYWSATFDAAEIAALMRAELCGRGWFYHREEQCPDKFPLFTYHVGGDSIWLTVWLAQPNRADIHRRYTLAEFRKALLSVARMPKESCSADVLKAIEGRA
jgi:hypothetical protein